MFNKTVIRTSFTGFNRLTWVSHDWNFSVIFLNLSFRVSTEELLVSLNTQDQVPDDTHTQNRQCVPCDFVENPLHYGQVLVRLLTKHDIPYPFLQLVSQDST